MKNLILFLMLFAGVFAGKAQDRDPWYGRSIIAHDALRTSPAILAALQDLQTSLGKATGQRFSLQFAPAPGAGGINVFPITAVNGNERLAASLTAKGPEAIALQDAPGRLLITGRSTKAVIHAIYTYLDGLGFRWYFPGELWSQVPRLQSVRPTASLVSSPFFRARVIAGTGGIVPIPSLDPQQLLGQSWDQWQARNRFGGEMELKGHYGEWFNIQHRKELEARPEFLAQVNGKRVAWSELAKWCISNPDFRQLYIADRLKEAAQLLARRSYPGEPFSVTVDPSDGGGDCECPACTKMGSPSERTFFLANETAKALAALGKGVFANLYAYNTHADPPKLKLTSNLIVQVIPYAFQSYGTPDRMISDWKLKTNHLFLYDYYGLADWHYDLPLSGRWSTDTLIAHMKFWARKGIQGYNLETAYSIGSAGPGLYLASRYGWSGMLDPKAERERMCRDLFGSGWQTALMYYEWMDRSFRGINDVVYLMHQLEAARQRTSGDTATRFLHLQAYLHYLLRYYQWKAATPAEAGARWQELMSTVSRLYFTGMIHSTRLLELLVAQGGTPEEQASWNPYRRDAARILAIRPFSDGELASRVRQDLIENPLLEQFPYRATAGRKYIASGAPAIPQSEQGFLLLNIPETYLMTDKEGMARFSLRVNTDTKNNTRQTVPVALVDTATGEIVAQRKLALDGNWTQVSLKGAAGKVYRFQIQPENWVRLRIPAGQWIGFRTIPTHAVLGKLYFFVQPEWKYIYFSNKGASMPLFQDAAGKTIQPETVNKNGLYRLRIPAGSRKGWWSIAGAEYQFLQFYDRPELFFPHVQFTVSDR